MAFAVLSRTRHFASAIALGAAMALPAVGFAGEVTLKSSDGTVNLVGEFVEFADNNYVIRTGLGDLRISAARVSCEGESCPTFDNINADVVFGGSDTVGDGLMPLLLAGYATFLGAEAQVTETGNEGEVIAELIGDEGFGDSIGNFLVSSTGSSDAFRKLLSKTVEIGMASRRIRPNEARALRDDGAGNMIDPANENIVAIDSLVVITNPENPVSVLTFDQLRGIYGGTIANWADIGGDDAPIQVLNRPESSGTRGVFESRLFGDDVPQPPASTQLMEGNTAMASAVNADPNAIGFVGYAFQRGAKPVSLINDCGIQTTPDAFSARTEEYALQRFLYLYSRTDNISDPSTQFLDYAISPASDEVIAKSGFIDLGIARRPQDLEGPRGLQLLDPDVDAFEGGVMREMLTEMVGTDRLSSTFRFKTGSQTLDPRGLLNLARLADYLENQPEGTKIHFVGFTDDVGAFESNRALSIGRADQVLRTLQDFAGDRLSGIEMSTSGYGEIAPTACNTTENERRINRRVEVWIEATDS